MPKFLTTIRTSAAIEEVIKNAKKRIVLISPYLKLSKQLYLRLKDAAQKDIPITVIYGKVELNMEERKQFESIKGIKLLFLHDLHAKCYFNESELIVTSMNMYEFSEKNNHEMGVLFSATEDKLIYDEVVEEAASFERHCSPPESNSSNEKASGSSNKNTIQKTEKPSNPTDSKKKKTEERVSFKIEKKYNKRCNYHFGALFDLLKIDYPSIPKDILEIDYEPYYAIELNDFPIRGVNMMIRSSIKFSFVDIDNFKTIKGRAKDTFEDKIPKANFYWNKSDLNIIPDDDQNFLFTEEGLRKKVGHYLEIIRVTATAIRKLPYQRSF